MSKQLALLGHSREDCLKTEEALPEDVRDYSDVENVLMKLKARGYDDISLNKIRYNNFYSYLTRI